jgi:hypothetical protein
MFAPSRFFSASDILGAAPDVAFVKHQGGLSEGAQPAEDAHVSNMSTFETDEHLRGTHVAMVISLLHSTAGASSGHGGAGAGSAAIEFFQDARWFAPRSGYVRV